jgi:hypothetical protein
MIARPLPAPERREKASRPGSRAARNASAVRRARNRRLRYRSIGRIVAGLCALTCFVLLYLALVANVTRLQYEIGRAQRDRARLVEQTQRSEDEIALLESRDRLEQLAARLGMRDPEAYAIVVIPQRRRRAAPPVRGVAALFPMVQSIMGVKL